MLQSFRNLVDAICYPFRMLARIPSNVISSPRKMLGLSLPARTALLLFFGLLVIIAGWSLFILSLDGTEQPPNFLWRELPILLGLAVLIPIVVWCALKLWLEGEPSPFPKIDQAWKSALEELKQHDIDPSETPIFLVLGPSKPSEVASLMNASNVPFSVQTPQGPSDIHVMANQDSIYVVCTQSCSLAYLLGGKGTSTPEPKKVSKSGFQSSQTMEVGFDDASSGPAEQPEGFGTIVEPPPSEVTPFGLGAENAGQSNSPRGSEMQSSVLQPLSSDAMQATMQVGLNSAQSPVFGAPGGSSAADTPSNGVLRLDAGRAAEASDKLAYLCRCIRRVRDPLAPLNGVLCVTPFTVIADGPQETVNQLQVALKSDVSTLRVTTRVRCSVTHLISGMENESGFRELIRRVGADRVASQRFGKGFGLWNLPKSDQLEALVKHACGAFEDWSYLLFRERRGIGKRGNRQLYSLLCRIRLRFMPRLAGVIQEGYKLENGSQMLVDREPMLFSGVYFVANGQTPDRQAFVSSVFGKARSEEEELEWGSEALAEESRMQTGVQILLVANGILAAAIVAMLIKMNM